MLIDKRKQIQISKESGKIAALIIHALGANNKSVDISVVRERLNLLINALVEVGLKNTLSDLTREKIITVHGNRWIKIKEKAQFRLINYTIGRPYKLPIKRGNKDRKKK